MKTAILGGGLTGLTLGYLMKQQGRDFEILEKEPECGGLMRTLEHQGFTFDYCGSHIIFSKNTEVLNFMLDLLQQNKARNRRDTKILYKGRLLKYPFENGLADLPKEENFECLYYFIQNLIKKEKGEIKKPTNLKEWFSYMFGKAIAEKYLMPYNEKIWKHPPEQMSLEWVERVPNPPMEDVIKSALGISTEGYLHQLHFYYPRIGGIQALIKAIENKIGQSNIMRDFGVTKIRNIDGKWVVSNGKQVRVYERIISTIPIQRLVKALNAPKKVKEAASNLKYNSLITVMIGLKRKTDTNLSWLYIPDREILTHRTSYPSNYSPNVAPAGMSALMAEITCKFKDETWRKRDDEIADRVVTDLQKLKIINAHDVLFTLVKRAEYAYVISDLDYAKNLKKISEHFSQLGIGLVGRFSEFKYLNMDDCIKSAMDYLKQENLQTNR
ncbi:MAG: FAD-dependent oxidoreductase [Candidatus Bathyarchaeota archaeon]|nr:FAD-dependent oxidoreductase [Candidatus Bathyarchaeota archaeon]